MCDNKNWLDSGDDRDRTTSVLELQLHWQRFAPSECCCLLCAV